MAVDKQVVNLPHVELEIKPGSYLGMAINAGHRVLFHTVLFGKDYFWLRDLPTPENPQGVIYLERAEPVDG